MYICEGNITLEFDFLKIINKRDYLKVTREFNFDIYYNSRIKYKI